MGFIVKDRCGHCHASTKVYYLLPFLVVGISRQILAQETDKIPSRHPKRRQLSFKFHFVAVVFVVVLIYYIAPITKVLV